MADGILGLGSSGSVELNSELIEKLKTAEEESILDPITDNIEDTETEIEAVDEINSKIAELLEVVETFDLYTSGTNVFNQVSANTSGSSATFVATDTSNISEGTINVSVTQLAQKDIYQSNIISDISSTMDDGTLTISVGDDTYEFETDGLTYEGLVTQLNYKSSLDASLEQVSDDSYRLVIKSAESGLSNALTIIQSGDLNLGYDDENNHVLTSQNLLASVDGIDYDLSSNTISLDNGLKITAIEEGDSSITISNDDSYIVQAMESLATVYNELVDLVKANTIGDEDQAAVVSDSSTLRSIMTDIKSMFYESYGLEDEENIFVYGISFDGDGYMNVDSTELSDAISNNYDDLKELFVGYAEKEGIGTKLNAYLDSLDSLDGVMTSYKDRLDDKKEDLEDEYEKESDRLDEKYQQMADQFASYTVIITEMETAFESLKQVIGDDD